MPFLNDMLADTARRQENADALCAETRSVENVIATNRLASGTGLNSRFQFDVDMVASHLRRDIIGQAHAIEAVVDMLRIVRADIADPRRPLYTSLMMGPTGVGKTELVRVLARAIHGDADALCRIDMNTLSQAHYAAAISGAPPGYVGSKEGRTILDQDKIEGTSGRPGIVLFDELEKASPTVVLSLLNVFDNGTLTTASGERTYSFRNAIIFMTSNLGSEEFCKKAEAEGGPLWRKLLQPGSLRAPASVIAQKVLLGRFPPEFVNRIDHINVFNWIDHADVDAIVELEQEKLNCRLARHQMSVELSPSLRKHIAKESFDRQFGARSLRRAVRRFVEIPLAKFLLSEPPPAAAQGRYYICELRQGSVSFREVAREEDNNFRKVQV